MYGRYGIDELYKFSIIIFLILITTNIFIRSKIILIIERLLFIIIIYRTLSKNKEKRRLENQKYLHIKNKLLHKIKNIKKRWNDRNTHMYRKCPKCKTTLRLPLKKGKHTVKCPKCQNRFKVKCIRNEKIKVEIIKNKSKK